MEKWMVTLVEVAVSLVGLNAIPFATSWSPPPGVPPPDVPASTVTVPVIWVGCTSQWKK